MNANVVLNDYSWMRELEKTVVQSLATSFGLDFFLFKDKLGGDVDTIHNARQGVYGTESERDNYQNRGDYNSAAYHQDKNYIEKGRSDKNKQINDKLYDAYTDNRIGQNRPRDLDHVQSAKEIHDDAGRVLAELDGVSLANQDGNLQSTNSSINRSKKDLSINSFLNKLPERIQEHEVNLMKDKTRLFSLSRNTPEEKNRATQLEDKIRKSSEKIKELKSVNVEKMRESDKKAREEYNQQVNKSYYTGNKFLQSTAMAAGTAGVALGARQVIGLMAAEVWFELREKLPKILDSILYNFSFSVFLDKIKETLKGIWWRISGRFNDFIKEFKNGVFAGVFSSISTTLLNVFATTSKGVIKIVREMWTHLTKAFKILFFNPDKLSTVEVGKAVTMALSAGVSAVIGSMVYAYLVPICSFPLGSDIAAFLGALTTGLATLGFTYVLFHSSIMKKIWAFLENSAHVKTVKEFQAINAQLDVYIADLARIELNLDIDELEDFSKNLAACNTEIERSFVLRQEIERRKIEMPYEVGNTNSMRQWLVSLAK